MPDMVICDHANRPERGCGTCPHQLPHAAIRHNYHGHCNVYNEHCNRLNGDVTCIPVTGNSIYATLRQSWDHDINYGVVDDADEPENNEDTMPNVRRAPNDSESGTTFVCACCGRRRHVRSNGTPIVLSLEGRRVCRECATQNFRRCRVCGQRFLAVVSISEQRLLHRNDISIWRADNGLWYCSEHMPQEYTQCSTEGCNNMAHHSEHIDPETNQPLCSPCFDSRYYRCAECGLTFSRSEHSNRSRICPACSYNYERRQVENYGVLNYSYKPFPRFQLLDYEDPEKTMFYGWEIEAGFNGSTDKMRDVARSMGTFVYCKFDSSIDDPGCEIVSHPMSLAWAHKNIDRIRTEVFQADRRKRFCAVGEGSCGMHVHMTKKFFSTLTLLKFLRFFYENKEFVLQVSQRGSFYRMGRYASLDSESADCTLKEKARYKSGGGRYTAINVTNSATVEVRVFQSTLNTRGFLKNLEFCDAVYHYAKIAGLKAVNIESFCEYVLKHTNTYRNLICFLYDRGLFATEAQQRKAKKYVHRDMPSAGK